MEYQISLPRSEKPRTGTYPESAEFRSLHRLLSP